MFFDPLDSKIAMDERGRLYSPVATQRDDDGNPIPYWAPIDNEEQKECDCSCDSRPREW